MHTGGELLSVVKCIFNIVLSLDIQFLKYTHKSSSVSYSHSSIILATVNINAVLIQKKKNAEMLVSQNVNANDFKKPQ